MTAVVGVVPARFASTRFEGKPLALIAGKPMILHVLERLKKCDILNDFFVATDDQRIADLVAQNGFQFIMTDSQIQSGTDRIAAALKKYKKPADIVVNIQGDEPLIEPEMLKELIQSLLENKDCEMSTLAHTLDVSDLNNSNAVKVICDDLGRALYFSRFAIPYSREAYSQAHPISLKHVGLYAYRKSFLEKFCQTPVHAIEKAESLEQLRALAMGAKIYVKKTSFRSWGVDTLEDIKKIEERLKEFKAGEK